MAKIIHTTIPKEYTSPALDSMISGARHLDISRITAELGFETEYIVCSP
jgi:hypothetical protein